jgi:hypothetical protein
MVFYINFLYNHYWLASHTMTNHSTRVLNILLIVLTMLTLTSACEAGPPAPIPWFTEHMEIEPVVLPKGVDVQVVLRNDPGAIRDFLVVTNTTPTPLYLTGEQWTGNTTFAGPVLKIVSGQGFYWGPIFDNPNSPARMGWKPENYYGRPDAVWLSIDANRLEGLDSTILKLEPRNQYEYGGHSRPENVDIPGPQTVFLGGGSGVVSFALLRRHHDLTAVVMDVENVCQTGREIASENKLEKRITNIRHNPSTSPPRRWCKRA